MNEKALVTLEQASKEIDLIVKKCAPLSISEIASFSDTLALAEGIKKLRQIFLTHAGIKETVEAMQDTRLGFLTDRSEKAIWQAKQGGKDLKPYRYQDIAECCIEAMLNGYRISGNEFNVIAGGFYAAKNGKYRKIIDNPNITNFEFTTTSPAYAADGKTAKVKCFASWLQDGQRASLGFSDPESGREDTLIFTIRVNSYMGDDAVTGKALSKLFTRVLMRVEGKVISESTDLDMIENGADSATPVLSQRAPDKDPDYTIKDAPTEPPSPGPEETPEPPKEEKEDSIETLFERINKARPGASDKACEDFLSLFDDVEGLRALEAGQLKVSRAKWDRFAPEGSRWPLDAVEPEIVGENESIMEDPPDDGMDQQIASDTISDYANQLGLDVCRREVERITGMKSFPYNMPEKWSEIFDALQELVEAKNAG